MKKGYYLIKTNDVLKSLDTSIDGLSEKEVLIRQNKYGKNELPKAKPKSFLSVFIDQFKSPIVYILLIAMILSVVVNEMTDAIFICIVLVMDALLGAFEEYRSNNNARKLASLIKVEAVVLRDGIVSHIPSSDLVVGDIVYLESGSRVPADIRLIETANLLIDEAILTGESVAREKTSKVLTKDVTIADQVNMAFVGTSVLRGRAKGVVVSIGKDTQMGLIASEVLNREETKTPLQIRMEKFTKQLGVLLGVLSIIIALILYYKKYTTREIFFLVVALSISAIPEGLPVVITLSLSLASNKLSKVNVLVKKLNAVEALGGSTMIATDKTGTLTLNEQTVKKIVLPSREEYNVSGIGYNDDGKISKVNKSNIKNVDRIIKEAVYNNEATLTKVKKEWVSLGDSMDIALLSLGLKYKLNINNKNIIKKIPYESDLGYSICTYKDKKEVRVAIKGSLEKIIEHTSKMCINGRNVKIDKELIRKQNETLAMNGYRVLAFASGIYKDNDEEIDIKKLKDLSFIGLIAFEDPIRKDVLASVKKCRKAGIKVVMITGDHPLTAFNIAKQLDITKSEDEVVTGNEIDKMLSKSEIEFDKYISNKKVFSRVTPIQKLKIVESFKRNGEFIAVSGDGVNDCPALKAANVSVAMGSGTDAAKETASLIITDDSFSSIVKGIEGGRNAYNNVRKVTYMLLSCAVSEVLFFVLAILFETDLPLTAIQLLWLNLATDGIQDTALTFEKPDKDIMDLPPRSSKESIFDRLLVNETLLSGLVMGVIVFGLWLFLVEVKHVEIREARACILMMMVLLQNVHCFNCRSEKISIFKKPIKDNKVLLYGVLGVLLMQVLISTINPLANILGVSSISLKTVVSLVVLVIPLIIVSEVFKLFERKKDNK